MPRNEDITRRELINPKIHALGWTEDLIRPERTVGQVEIIAGRPRRGKGRMDYLLCLPAEAGKSPLPTCAPGTRRSKAFRLRVSIPGHYLSLTKVGRQRAGIFRMLPFALR